MEVRLGYKQTELGVIPDDWGFESLVDLVDPARSIRYGIVQPGKYDPNGRYMIRGQDYSEAKGWASPAEVFRVSAGVEERYRNARVRAGDLIMTIVGYCGHVEQVPAWLDGANLTQTTARIAIEKTRADDRFCKYMLQSSVGAKQVAGFLKAAAQPGLNCGDVEKFLLPLPASRVEQSAIATALSDVDALLGELERLIAKKRDLKQAAMQQLLTGQTRLPGFHGEWEMKPFVEVLVRLNAKAYQIQTSDYQGTGKFPVVDQGKELIVGFSDRDEKRLRCPDGGVIVFGDHTCVVKFIDFDFLVGADGTQILQGRAGQSTRFHAFHLQHRGVEPTGYNRHFKFLRERDFVVPPLPEQIAIAAVLSDMDAELGAIVVRRDKTRDLKQAMMQELLTGKTRLVPAGAAHA